MAHTQELSKPSIVAALAQSPAAASVTMDRAGSVFRFGTHSPADAVECTSLALPGGDAVSSGMCSAAPFIAPPGKPPRGGTMISSSTIPVVVAAHCPRTKSLQSCSFPDLSLLPAATIPVSTFASALRPAVERATTGVLEGNDAPLRSRMSCLDIGMQFWNS
jgi:hypothetical protein